MHRGFSASNRAFATEAGKFYPRIQDCLMQFNFIRIFVPSSRNTLADILLGKASPLKKSRRSISASPTKGRGKSVARPLVPETPLLRRSPRKQAKDLSKCFEGDIRPGMP